MPITSSCDCALRTIARVIIGPHYTQGDVSPIPQRLIAEIQQDQMVLDVKPRPKASKLQSNPDSEQFGISGAKLNNILRLMGELMSIAIHLLSSTGASFKKANKWLRSPSFKVGQPRPSSSAFAYMRGP